MTAPESLRLACFAPVPPAASGIADYVVGLAELLPAGWELEFFAPEPAETRAAGRPVHAVSAWGERHAAAPFDLNVYHVGNNALHESTLPLLSAHPGLLVLHDVVLHPSRAEPYLHRDHLVEYRTALGVADPELGARAADVVAAGLGGPSLYWNLPFCEDLVRASRHTVVHGELLARWLGAQIDGATIGSVVHWHPVADVDAERVAGWRERLGVADGAPLLGAFGYLGPEHRIRLVLDALAALREQEFHLAVVGSVDPTLELEAAVAERGLQDRVTPVGRASDVDFAALLHAADLGLNLRYPTARASSGTLVQLLRTGTPAVIHDLVHLRDLPDDAVLRVPTGARDEELAALIDTLRAWLTDPARRERAAGAARRHGATITREAMRASYETAVTRALDA